MADNSDKERSVVSVEDNTQGAKLRRCLYSSLIHIVGGVSIGILFTGLLYKRKPWPVALGGGLGFIKAYTDCNSEFEYKGPFTRLYYPDPAKDESAGHH